jgi:hypothetical protein
MPLSCSDVPGAAEVPPAKALLASDETIINPYYMKQLLEYGIKLGQQAQAGDIDPAHLAKEAQVCAHFLGSTGSDH